ncbi:MAG: hypothetical protein MUC81_03365 [Bacteroidia bacterium]|nr:hypothetical protein [Bacteroidia bacterium]
MKALLRNNHIRLVYTIISVVILLMLSNIANAQYGNTEEYEDDYSVEYESENYNNSYYERSSEEDYYKRYQRNIKRSYKEEELYNGGYRNINTNNSQIEATAGFTGWRSMGNWNKNNSPEIPFDENKKPNSRSFFQNNIEDGDIKPAKGGKGSGHVGKDGAPSDEPGTGGDQPGNGGDEKTPDPPPDDPDIPINDYIFELLILGIILGTYKTKQMTT